MNKNQKYSEVIIFPYRIENDTVSHYLEDELKVLFPNAYKYLSKNKTKLEKETRDVSTQWFEFGRTQSLDFVIREKILIPRILTNNMHIKKLGNNTIPYSGIIVIPKKELSIDDSITVLSSKRFVKYLNSVSCNLQGKSIQVSTSDIKEYRFNEKALRNRKGS